jgi:holliday junction DNA helicase RuvA
VISRIRGKIIEKKQYSLLIDVSGICYEVLIPTAIMEEIGSVNSEDDTVELVTYYYHRLEPSRSVPIMIGFSNEIEREFFEEFTSVSGIGPKAAVKALILPISVIAEAIDSSNHSLLQTLPGIGKQRAREIIAKLQGKVGKFGLIQDEGQPEPLKLEENAQEEALEVLLQLKYKKSVAEKMMLDALKNNPHLKTAEGILNEIYYEKRKHRDKERS